MIIAFGLIFRLVVEAAEKRIARFARASLELKLGFALGDANQGDQLNLVIFIGINPPPVSVSAGHSFATPGNRFWPALHAAGFTDRVLSPHQERDLLHLGLGAALFAALVSLVLKDAEVRAAMRWGSIPLLIAFLLGVYLTATGNTLEHRWALLGHIVAAFVALALA